MSYPSDGQNPYQNSTGNGQQETQSYQDPYAQTQSGSGQSVYSGGASQQQPTTAYAQQSASDPYGNQQGQYGQPAQYGDQGQYGQGYNPAGGMQPYGYQQSPSGPARPPVKFGQAVKAWFQNYATFYGRANRGEFWWVYLFQIILSLIFTFAVMVPAMVAASNASTYGSGSTGSSASPIAGILGILFMLWGLATIVPTISLGVRRLHDAGYSGWFYLLTLIGGIGGIVILVLCAMDSKPEGARFDNPNGTQPKSGGAELTNAPAQA